MDGKVIDYEKEVKESVQAEFNQFYGDTVALDSVSVYRKAYEINMKNTLYEYGFCGAVNFPKKIYRALYEERGSILNNLFNHLDEDFASVSTAKEVEETITDYCESMYGELMDDFDCKQRVLDGVHNEYELYELNLLQGTPEEVYSHSYETTVKTEIHDAIYEEHEFSDKVYKALCKDEGHILEDLYQTFIGDLDANLFSKEGRKQFVEDYCQEYHQDIMSEDTGMNMG